MLTGNMPEHAALYLPSLTADYAPLGMQKSHNSTSTAENSTQSSKCLQQLVGTSTPLKAYEALRFVQLVSDMQRKC